MTSWNIEFIPETQDTLQKLDEATQERIIEKLEWLKKNFDDISPLQLSSVLKGYCKLRVGSMRIIYTVDLAKSVLMVRAVGPRDKIYKRFGVKA